MEDNLDEYTRSQHTAEQSVTMAFDNELEKEYKGAEFNESVQYTFVVYEAESVSLSHARSRPSHLQSS